MGYRKKYKPNKDIDLENVGGRGEASENTFLGKRNPLYIVKTCKEKKEKKQVLFVY